MSKKTVVTAVSLLALAALLAVGYLLTIGAGSAISSNLSVVGQGKPVLVLAYANYSPEGGEALNRLRKVKSDYDSKLGFAVADLGTPEGSTFAGRYSLQDGQVVLVDGDGQLPQRANIPPDELELRNLLNSMLKAVE